MKILLLDPQNPSSEDLEKIAEIKAVFLKIGYQVFEVTADAGLYQVLKSRKPDLVLNLASVYDEEKANRIPAILEIAGVPYIGSGMLCLSLNRFYNQLFPLVSASDIDTVPFRTIKADESGLLNDLAFPVNLFREGSCKKRLFRKTSELEKFLRTLPPHDEVILFHALQGKLTSIFILDRIPFLTKDNQPCLEPAAKIYDLIEARGLASFDFVIHDGILFAGMDSAPDPLNLKLSHDMAENGWNQTRLLVYMVKTASSDLRHDGGKSPS